MLSADGPATAVDAAADVADNTGRKLFQNESAPFLVFFFFLFKKKNTGAPSPPPLNVICVFCATLECLGNFVSEFFMFQVLSLFGEKCI